MFCSSCNADLPAAAFYSTGHQCRKCKQAKNNAWRAENIDHYRAMHRAQTQRARRRAGIVPIAERPRETYFWSKVNRLGKNECWPWTGFSNKDWYGVFWNGSKLIGAHRFAYALSHEIPDGAWVLHRCDNPPCVNPTHLFIGNQTENMRDMMRKGRGNKSTGDGHWTRRHPERLKGELNPNARLTDEQVQEIRALYATGAYSQSKLSLQFHVYQSHISSLVHNKKRA